MPTRAEIAERLQAWSEGRLGPAELVSWAERQEAGPQAGAGSGDPALEEALADLALLGVNLLTPEDVPALRGLLEGSDPLAAADAWRRYRDAIDLDARSRRLRREPFYRPFCR